MSKRLEKRLEEVEKRLRKLERKVRELDQALLGAAVEMQEAYYESFIKPTLKTSGVHRAAPTSKSISDH